MESEEDVGVRRWREEKRRTVGGRSDGVEKKMLKKIQWCVNCVTDILRY